MTATQTQPQSPIPFDAVEVSGIVVDMDGAPAKNVSVFGRSTPMSCQQVGTDSDGKFVLNALVPGQLTLIAKTAGYGIKLADFRISAPLGPKELTSAGLRDIRLVVGPPGSISGTVLDAAGAPVPDVDVHANYFPSVGIMTQPPVTTDETGSFRIDGCAPATYQVGATPRGVGWSTANAHAEIPLARGQHVTGVTLRHAGTARLSGVVVDEAGGPVADAEIWCQATDFQIAKSNKDGTFHFLVTAGDSCRLSLRHPSYRRKSLTVVSGGADIRLVLQKRIPLRVQVLCAETDAPLPEYEIAVISGKTHQVESRWDAQFRRVNDAHGRCELASEDSEPATLIVRAAGFGETTRYVCEEEQAQGALVKMVPESTLSGRVVNGQGNPVPHARVYLGGIPQGDNVRTDTKGLAAITGTVGEFEIRGLSSEEQLLAVYASDCAVACNSVVPGRDRNLEIVLSPGGSIEGCMQGLEPDDRPSVQLVRSRPFMNDFAPVVDGRYAFGNLSPGEYEVFCYLRRAGEDTFAGEYASLRTFVKRIVVEEGKLAHADFDCSALDACIEGVVRVDGKPSAPCLVQAVAEDVAGRWMAVTRRTNPNGEFRIERMLRRRITLTASAKHGDGALLKSVQIDVETARTVADFDLESDALSTVKGHVRGISPGDQVEVNLRLGPSEERGTPMWRQYFGLASVCGIEPNADGSFEIANAPVGACAVTAWATRGVVANDSEARSKTRTASVIIETQKGKTKNVTLDLREESLA